jgi:fermentation-respiration switch protein FrsA (DUF1100 family)
MLVDYNFIGLFKWLCGILCLTLTNCSVKDSFTFFPDRVSEIPMNEIPSFAKEHMISTADSETIQSFYFHHQSEKQLPLLIYFHGNAGNLYSRFEPATRIYQLGYDVLLVSYRGYAKSTGKPTEQGIFLDGEAAVNYAISKLGYQDEHIALLGRSLGSTVAVHIAQHRNFYRVLLITPLTSGRDMAVAMGLGMLKFLAGNSYNSLEKINNLTSPMLIIHGDRDEVVPYHMGKSLFETYNGPKHMVTIKNGRHNDLADVDPVRYWGEIERFLARAIGGKP